MGPWALILAIAGTASRMSADNILEIYFISWEQIKKHHIGEPLEV